MITVLVPISACIPVNIYLIYLGALIWRASVFIIVIASWQIHPFSIILFFVGCQFLSYSLFCLIEYSHPGSLWYGLHGISWLLLLLLANLYLSICEFSQVMCLTLLSYSIYFFLFFPSSSLLRQQLWSAFFLHSDFREDEHPLFSDNQNVGWNVPG